MHVARRRATIGDVAELAGVSKATVSRVLNSSERVLPATRETVQRAIDAIGYQESWQAKSLATGRAGAIGVLLTEPFDDVYTDPTFAALLRGVYDRLATTDVVPILLQASSERERQKAVSLLQRRAADAVIHLTPYVDDGLLPHLVNEGIPTVVTGRPAHGELEGSFSAVYSDDVAGARLAAHHAAERGRTRPLVVMGPRDNPASVERVQGYREVFADLSDDAVVFGGWDSRSGRAAVEAAVRGQRELDVVLAGSDRIALGVLDALASHGMRVPEDVSVIGFDNHPLATSTIPALTTVEQPLRAEGEAAAELALALLAGEKPTVQELAMRLVVRASA
jgi:DNA-binding LacI/PurR family transcriptional regulator